MVYSYLKRMNSVAGYPLGSLLCIDDSEALLFASEGLGQSPCRLQL